MKSPFGNLSLSLQELIAVIVPGSAIIFLLYKKFGSDLLKSLGNGLQTEKVESNWPFYFAFFAASYFVGYALFVASSPFEKFYDRVKRFALGVDTVENPGPLKIRTLLYFFFPGIGAKYIKEGTPKKPTNRVVNFFFPYLWNTHQLIQAIVEHKNNHIGSYHDGFRNQTIDAYQYSYRLIMAKQEDMFSEVERYMVTAKFFRSMTIGWLICGVIWIWPFTCVWPCPYLWIFIGLSAISFFTFLDRWRKAHHVAFKNVIISESIRKDAPPNPFIGLWNPMEKSSKSQIEQIAIEQVPGTWTKVNIKIETHQGSDRTYEVAESPAMIDPDDKIRLTFKASPNIPRYAELCMDGDKLVMMIQQGHSEEKALQEKFEAYPPSVSWHQSTPS